MSLCSYIDLTMLYTGLDQQPGREGGTWLGMNTDGKVGVLLNILGEQVDNKRGRGDYLLIEQLVVSL